jgi:hypothetical protein
MPINPAVKSYAELDINDLYQLRIEHQHDKKYDLHSINIKRKVLDADTKKDTEILPDIRFNLDTEHFKQFCQFFTNINEVSYANSYKR